MPRNKNEDEARKNLRKTDRNKAKAAKDKQGVRKHYEKQDRNQKKDQKKGK